MKGLEDIEGIKITESNALRIYGECLLERLQKVMDFALEGNVKNESYLYHGERAVMEGVYAIKKRGGIFSRFNPFAKKIVRIIGPKGALPGVVTVYDRSVGKDVSDLVKELNSRSKLDFKILLNSGYAGYA